jgi:hypothetical protein
MTPEQQASIDAARERLQARGQVIAGGSSMTPEQMESIRAAESRLANKAFDVIKTLPDGSQVIQFNDGSMQVLNQEAGLASSDPDIVNAAMRGESPLQASRMKRGEEIVSQAPAGARAAKLLEGVPFVGSYMDEILGQTPRQEAQVRGMQSAMETTRPGESLALQATGGLAGGAALGAAGAQAGGAELLRKIATLPRGSRYLSYLGLGAIPGGIEGGIYGYGTGQTPEERQAGAQQMGMLGAATGGAAGVGLPAIGTTLSKGFANFKSYISQREASNIATELGVSPQTARVIRDAVQTTDADLADMLAAIDRAGEQGMIADADVATQVLLDAAAAAEGGASAIVRSAVEGRAQQAGQGLGRTMDETIVAQPRMAGGELADVQDIATSIAAETRPQRQAAYNQAYSTPIDYTSDAGRAIESLIGRIPAGTLRNAIQEANDAMKVDGVGQRQIMADIGQDGSVTFIEMPNTVQADYIKRALGTIGQGVDTMGRPTAEAARAQRLYRELSKSLTEAVPAYGDAVRLGGDKIGRDTALEIGERALNKNVTPREVVRNLANLDEGQRVYAKVGLRDSIQQTIDNVKATIASPDVDVNALRTVLRDLSSEANRAKVKAIIGKDASDKLFRELEKAGAALSLKAAVAVNSKTAIRQATKESIEQYTQPGVMQAAMRGEPLQATQRVIQAVTGETGEFAQAQKNEIMREIAQAMTSARGEEAKRQLRVIYNAVRSNQATQEQFQQAADFLINSVTLPATMFGVGAVTREETR